MSLYLLLPDLLQWHVLDLVLRVESSDIYGSSVAELGTRAGLLHGGATEPSQVNEMKKLFLFRRWSPVYVRPFQIVGVGCVITSLDIAI